MFDLVTRKPTHPTLPLLKGQGNGLMDLLTLRTQLTFSVSKLGDRDRKGEVCACLWTHVLTYARGRGGIPRSFPQWCVCVFRKLSLFLCHSRLELGGGLRLLLEE